MLTRMDIQTAPQLQPFPKLAYSLAECEALSGLSRSSLYRLIAARKLNTVQRGRRRLVPADELMRLCSVPNRPDPEAAS
jgi:excisionase family DNA binding protein